MSFFGEIREAFLIAIDSVRANTMRSLLTMLGIIIGIVTVTLMGAAIQGLNGAFRKSIAAIGADVLYVQRHSWFSDEPWWKMRNRRDVTMTQARAVARQLTLAQAVSIETQTFKSVKYGDRTADNVWVMGNTADSAVARGLTIRDGRFLSEAEVDGGRPVCVLGFDLSDAMFPQGGALGKTIKVGESNFEVIGTLEKLGEVFGSNLDNQIVIPVTRFVTHIEPRNDLMIVIKVGDVALMEDAREEVRGVMRRVRRLAPEDSDDFGINQQDVFIKMFNRVGGLIATAGLFITSLSLFVGGIGIMNIMYVSVAERTREIGTRKAIGAKSRTILIQFLMEAAILCLLGGMVALLIAWPLTMVISRFLPTSLSPLLISIALGVSLLTGLVSGFLPAWRAARMNPVDALRSE